MGKYPIIIALMLTACCNTHTETTYSYKGTVIKRVDECGRTVFFYNNSDKDANMIWVEYSGINDGFSGYLKFDDNGKVQLLSGDGYFQTMKNIDTTKFKYTRILAHQRPTLGGPVYYIELSTRYEKLKNQNSNIVVKAIYSIENSE